jgi:exonuclease III
VQKTSKKIISLTREKDDVIFLCDIRLNSDKQVSATLDLIKRFGFRGYSFFHNSKTNSRGVGLLISNKLKTNIHNIYNDINGNLLLLDVSLQGERMTIGTVYGPNRDDEDFFLTLEDTCTRFGNSHIILGGDWNTTVDSRNSNSNMDVINMVNIPSKRRSIWLKN